MRPDIVYLFAKGHSGWRDNELKYSLRSLEKYGQSYRFVYVVGDKPIYLNDRIIHIEYPEDGHNKEKNICDKILRACSIPQLSDPFVFFNDDFMIIKPIDFSNLPYYYQGILDYRINGRLPNDVYRQSLLNTRDALESKGLETKYYDIHYCIYYEKQKFIDCMNRYDWNIKRGFTIKSLYANTLKIKGEPRTDCKVEMVYKEKEIMERIKDTDLFSTGEISRAMINVLNKLFPTPSKFEL